MPKYTFKSKFATEFEHIAPKLNRPTVLYLHGFCSDPWGRKPDVVKEFCISHGIGFFRVEFAGHGSDASNFENTDFDIWKNQVIEVIDEHINGSVILVGSSMGGWLSFIAALERPKRIQGIIGLAAAPNFVKIFEPYISEEQKNSLDTKGKFEFGNEDFTYTITKKFIDTALTNLLPEKDGDIWDINCPVHLLQGMKDASYPWERALRIAALIKSENVMLKIFKSSNHRLGDDEALAELIKSLANIVNIVKI